MSAALSIVIEPGVCTITCTNQYAGFDPVQTRRGKHIYVLGAPRLYGTSPRGVVDDEVLPSLQASTSGAILQVLLGVQDIRTWGSYLAGNFALIIHDTLRAECWVITDLGNSFRLLHGRTPAGVRISTDADRLAIAVGGADDIDHVSLVEYLTQVSITYPFTFYRGVEELAYASATCVSYRGDVSMTTTQYWLPSCREGECVDDIRTLAPTLREGVVAAARASIADRTRVGLFLSGGMDSRAIAGILAWLDVQGTAITVVDAPNRESRLAAQIAAATGHAHEVWLRDAEYYPRLCDVFIASEGPHATFTRGLYLGFRDRLLARGFDVLFGGYMSDTLLKLHEANVCGQYPFGRHLGPLEKFDPSDRTNLRGGDRWREQFYGIFRRELLEAAAERRRQIVAYWEDLRRDGSAWEWSWMWPFFRNQHNDNLTSNIHHYSSYELFTEREVIEVARVASQRIKINGRLFNAAMWPFLKRTAHIPNSVTGLRLFRSPRLHAFAITMKYFPPRRWMFPEETLPVPVGSVATSGSYSNMEKVWMQSPLLAAYRAAYEMSALEERIMEPSAYSVFTRERYRGIPTNRVSYIMYTMLHLDRWRKMMNHNHVSSETVAITEHAIPL